MPARITGLFRAAAALALGAFLVTVPPVQADQSTSLETFFGVWTGSGLSENAISSEFKLTVRDVDVVIQAVDGGGFTVKWSTVQRKKGNPDNPTEILKETSRTFLPTEKPGVWRGRENGDPLKGELYLWARLDGDTLVVNSLGIHEDGSYEVQTYQRTIDEMGMKLRFIRILDGYPVRSARGRLIKVKAGK